MLLMEIESEKGTGRPIPVDSGKGKCSNNLDLNHSGFAGRPPGKQLSGSYVEWSKSVFPELFHL